MITILGTGAIFIAIVLTGLLLAEVVSSVVEYWAVEDGWVWLWAARGVVYGITAPIVWFVLTSLVVGQVSIFVSLAGTPVLVLAFHWVDDKSYAEFREHRIRFGSVKWVDHVIDDEARAGGSS